MPDLMKTPSNRRYVVNFQHREPKNKYDIWLSFNKHEQGNQVIVDSDYLADKDLVFKIYMNGKWVPILGIPVSYEGIIQAIEELDKKKMNLIKPTPLVEGHIPVIHQGSDECDQLIDGGSIEELVTAALTTIINGGGVIPIQRANTSDLGGIKADIHNPAIMADGFVEAKFKGAEGSGENDRLYISAREIANALINIPGGSGFELQVMGPSTLGGATANEVPASWDILHYLPVLIHTQSTKMYVSIDDLITKIITILGEDPNIQLYVAGEGIDITDNVISNILATYNTIGGIKAYTHDSNQDAVYGIQPKFGGDGIWDVEDPTYNIDEEHLCITKTQLLSLLNISGQEMFRNGWGTFVQYNHIWNSHTSSYDDFITISLEYDDNNDRDKYLKSKADGTGIEWVTLPSGQSYPPLTASSTSGDECVVVAPQDKTGFLRGDGQFVPISNGSTVSWSQIWGSTGSKIAEITIDGITTNVYAPNAIYYGNNGITVNQNTHYIGLNLTGANPDYILSYNGTGIEWIPQLHYTSGVGIEITSNNTINSVIENNSNPYEATTSLVFNCVYASAQHPSGGITMIPDNTPSSGTTLDPYTYTEVTLKMTGLTAIDVQFNTATQLNFMKGDPVYVMLDLSGKVTQVSISVPSTNDKDWLINVNNAVIVSNGNSCLDITNYSRFLCTLQFGTVKIEPLEATVSQNDNSNQQEEP